MGWFLYSSQMSVLRGAVLAEKAVVAESVKKEPVAFSADLLHALLIAIAQERRGHREIGIDGVAQGLAFVFDHFVIILHPLARFFRRHERKRQRAHAEFRGLNDRLAARTGHPQRRMRLLQRLRNHVARAAP